VKDWRVWRNPATIAATAAFAAVARPASPAFFWSGVAVAAAGLALRLWAAGHIRKDRSLTTVGPYALVRHPLYLGSTAIAAGSGLAISDPTHWALSAAFVAAAVAAFGWLYLRTIETEEAHLARVFDGYADYSSKVPRVLPTPSRVPAAFVSSRWDWPLLLKNRELSTLSAAAGVAVALRLKMVWP
jgi:protein-S-isoprenylcysteine O-methyltransferase Ste14